MILLNTGVNTITVTVKEKATITNAQYVFIFVNSTTEKKVACTSTLISTLDNKSKFLIDVGVNSPLTNQILLDDYGFYNYYIYEVVNAAIFNYAGVNSLDLRTMTGEVEQGKMYWQKPTTTNNIYKDVITSSVSYGQ